MLQKTGLLAVLVVSITIAGGAVATDSRYYNIGTPVLTDIWVDPVNGNDANTGTVRGQALRTLTAAWNRIPVAATLTGSGRRVMLTAGNYPESSLPNYLERRYGTFSFPVIFQAADGPGTAVLQGDLNIFDCRYLYLIDLTIRPVPAGDTLHFEQCSNILMRGLELDGGVWTSNGQTTPVAHETLKINQSQYIYLEDSNIHGADDNAVDYVAVQYGHAVGNRIHNCNDWAMYVKGGSAYLRIEANEFYDAGTGGFTTGQGTGFEFMTAPWLHYEAYDIKVINNLVHDTEGAGLGVNGGYNILMGWNTLYRVGRRSHVIEIVPGSRSCDGDTVRCQANRTAGGWGGAIADGQYIPARNVFIFNNIVYNPAGYQSQWQHFEIRGPVTPPAGSGVASPSRVDVNLRIRGNIIWNGPPSHSLGLGSDTGCQPSNTTCNETQLRAENAINTLEPQLVNPAAGDYRPRLGSNITGVTSYQPGNFDWVDAPSTPTVPSGNPDNQVQRDFSERVRNGTGPAGAWLLVTSGIGTNLEVVEDYAVAYPFANFFKQSRAWITGSATVFDTQQTSQLDLDSNGWVRSLPACTSNTAQYCLARTVFNSGDNPYPTGRYTIIYEGQGTLSYSGGATKVSALSSPGRDVIDVNGNLIWILTLESTNSTNYLRNIRVYPPGIDPLNPPIFHPDFIKQLAPSRSVRFMDWMRTNGSGYSGQANTQSEFVDRTTLAQARWSLENGVPLEAMIDLANQANVEPWFTLPHRASDSYVDQFAQLVLQRLAPQRQVYIEYSNEVWNSAFPQGGEVEAKGALLFGNSGDPFIRRLNAHGLRTAQICHIFKTRFGIQADRVTCVLGAQAANSFTTTEAADCPLAVQSGQRTTPCRTDIDAVAIAPYFGNYLDLPVNTNELQNWSVNTLFNEIRLGGQLQDLYPNVATPCSENWPPQQTGSCSISALQEIVPWISAHSQEANSRNLRLLAYEGGQHLVGVFGAQDNQAVSNLFVEANRSPLMADVYTTYLNSWKSNGGEIFMHFTLTFAAGKYGSWGALESLTPVQRPPKAAAIDSFVAANPCWWSGCQ
ncbi:MAG: right-handed parallel beta-helix repeat-containing protein [Acidobacteria bacterium]|nr:right-handed parallel beta-helix repeat-containing protein [Acidobacteriota bacterium]